MSLKFGSGDPWIVFNSQAMEGQVISGLTVADLQSPDYLTSSLTEVDTDPLEEHRVVLETATCPAADYFVCGVTGNNPHNPTAFYYRKSEGNQEWNISEETSPLPNHFAATTEGTVYGAWQDIAGHNIHLLRSDNNGESFDDFQGTYSVPPAPPPVRQQWRVVR